MSLVPTRSPAPDASSPAAAHPSPTAHPVAALPTSKPFPEAFGSELAPPWTLKGDAWWFFPSPTLLPWSARRLPPATFDPLQAQTADESGKFIGGLSNIQLLRYTDSPVGPYDELLFVPGEFDAFGGKGASASLRVTRIYVSSLASVVNGRRNWNIPKRLARFEFTPIDSSKPSGPIHVSVYACTSPSITTLADVPTFASTPFFSVILAPSSIPAVPVKTKYVPLNLRLAMPPLVDGTDVGHAELVGTERWVSVTPSFEGPCRPVWGKGALDSEDKRWADGDSFPDVVPYSLGLYWKDVIIGFPSGQVYDPA